MFLSKTFCLSSFPYWPFTDGHSLISYIRLYGTTKRQRRYRKYQVPYRITSNAFPESRSDYQLFVSLPMNLLPRKREKLTKTKAVWDKAVKATSLTVDVTLQYLVSTTVSLMRNYQSRRQREINDGEIYKQIRKEFSLLVCSNTILSMYARFLLCLVTQYHIRH